MAHSDPISQGLHDRLFEAFFTATLKAESDARQNADRAFAVASAVAAALVAAGVAINIRSRPVAVQVAGVAALTLWLAAAYAFMAAVSHSKFPVGAPTLAHDQWGNQTIEGALVTRREIYDKLRHAKRWSVAAGLATLVALVLALVDTHVDTAAATLTLHRDGAAGLRSLCGGRTKLSGSITLDSLDSQFVLIKLPPGACGQSSRTLRLDRSDVIAVRTK